MYECYFDLLYLWGIAVPSQCAPPQHLVALVFDNHALLKTRRLYNLIFRVRLLHTRRQNIAICIEIEPGVLSVISRRDC